MNHQLLVLKSELFAGMLTLPQPPPEALSPTLSQGSRGLIERAAQAGLDGTTDEMAVALPETLSTEECEIFLEFVFNTLLPLQWPLLATPVLAHPPDPFGEQRYVLRRLQPYQPLARALPDRRHVRMGERLDPSAHGVARSHSDPTDGAPLPPASVVEISGDAFPPLAAPAPATVTKPRAKATKASKGKGKAKTAAATAVAPTSDNDNPFLTADIAAATAASLGLPAPLDHATEGTSTSRRPAAAPGSPPKRRRSNMAGDASPAPVPIIAATPTNAAQAPVPTANPVALVSAAPATTPVATPLIAVPAAAPAAAPVAVPIAAPVVAVPAATYAAALVAAPATAPAAAPVTAPVAAPIAPPVAALFNAPIAAPAAAPVAAPAAAPALPPLWLTADNLPPRGSYTPTPAGGFPPIMYSLEQLLQGVPADLVRMYEDVGFPKFFLVVSGGNGAVMRTHGLIREAIANYINIDPTTFTLGTPPTAANGSSPTLWLAADIPDPLAQGIVDARILSSTNITLYTLPYNMPIIGFVGVFAGFMLPNTVMGANAAWDLIGTAVQANSEISQFVQTHRDAFGPQVSSGEAWGTFLASITVHGIVLIVNDTNTVAWRLHQAAYHDGPARYGATPAGLQMPYLPCHRPSHSTVPAPRSPWLARPDPHHHRRTRGREPCRRLQGQEQMRLNTADGAGSSSTRSGTGRGQSSFDRKARRGGKAKRGGDFKGKGKRRKRDDFL
ncbi:hypothetical protein B0H14DRAFT_3510923 [Mycena olivaceomarginata]|nr:hypothetical protein B0H14DRAFT_3510923 [Mycena olivaceomarginata]